MQTLKPTTATSDINIATHLENLNNNTNNILQSVKSCSTTDLTYSKNGRWCILQILEHICLADKSICLLISKPSGKVSETAELIGDEKIRKVLVEQREQKFMSPEFLKPKGGITDAEAFELCFLQQRNSLQQDIQTGKLKIDNRIHRHPYFGDSTISDWLNFMIHHTQRHLDRINEIVTGFKSGINNL